jgi:hypothetical protein
MNGAKLEYSTSLYVTACGYYITLSVTVPYLVKELTDCSEKLKWKE